MNNCIWTYDENLDYYDTSSGNANYFVSGDVAYNEYKYCPYCGGEIVEKE